jgi:hypothetical protein
MEILRALPSNIVVDIIYPLAVRVIKDRHHLIYRRWISIGTRATVTQAFVAVILLANGMWNK